MTRKDYLDGKVSHDAYYSHLADIIGREALASIVHMIATPERIKASTDPHLNDIPLRFWDSCDGSVRALVSRKAPDVMAVSWHGAEMGRHRYCWSLSETVCVLKAVARGMVSRGEVVRS